MLPRDTNWLSESRYDAKTDPDSARCLTRLGHFVLLAAGGIRVTHSGMTEEARKIAASPKYNCLAEFEAVKAEVEAKLAKTES
jgi:hypothetical protein